MTDTKWASYYIAFFKSKAGGETVTGGVFGEREQAERRAEEAPEGYYGTVVEFSVLGVGEHTPKTLTRICEVFERSKSAEPVLNVRAAEPEVCYFCRWYQIVNYLPRCLRPGGAAFHEDCGAFMRVCDRFERIEQEEGL